MIIVPLGDGNVLAIIEPGNIKRLKEGKPLYIGGSMLAYVPDIEAFAKLLGVNEVPRKDEINIHNVRLTPDDIVNAIEAVKNLPEVER